MIVLKKYSRQNHNNLLYQQIHNENQVHKDQNNK